ncbi:hypothetical protein LJC07_03870 [Christensenellaceae bacterium OttesenSCG-928-L17]|nr:hypothetical protein [Christensenellaceae bacterium OttesenSCG-928-L17]
MTFVFTQSGQEGGLLSRPSFSFGKKKKQKETLWQYFKKEQAFKKGAAGGRIYVILNAAKRSKRTGETVCGAFA